MSEKKNDRINKDTDLLKFVSYGVKIAVKTTHKRHLYNILTRLKSALPQNFELIDNQNTEHLFEIVFSDNNFILYKDDKHITSGESEINFFNFLESKIRLTVAEYAKDKVFIHAGVVKWKDQAIVIPAGSFKGKTTIVKELIKCGAIYYSDEYAVIDENGLVHPFPKTLSIRGIIDDYRQVECSAESFGAVVGQSASPIGLVLITHYERNSFWNPTVLTNGQGIMEIIPHTLPIRLNPKFTLQVLNKVVSRAIICKSSRGDAEEFAQKILEFFDINT